jgi:hypothetical protein
MANGYMSPLPTFTLESLVAFRQWSSQQKSTKKKAGSLHTNQKNQHRQPTDRKNLKSSE